MGDRPSMHLDSWCRVVGCPILHGVREGWGFVGSQAEPVPCPPAPSPPRKIIAGTPRGLPAPIPRPLPIAPVHRPNKSPRQAGLPHAPPAEASVLPERPREKVP